MGSVSWCYEHVGYNKRISKNVRTNDVGKALKKLLCHDDSNAFSVLEVK